MRAQRSRAEAQRRFDGARKLTGSLLVDFYEAVRKLDHSEPALQSLVRWSQETLERLSAESGQDASLQTDLAEYYLKLGILQAGQPVAALGSFDQGLVLADRTLDRNPGSCLERRWWQKRRNG